MKLLFLASMITQGHLLFAQTTAIDSLRERLSTPLTDSIKLEVLLKLSEELQERDTEQAIKFAQQAVDLSQRMGENLAKGRSVTLLGAAHATRGNLDSAMIYLRSAEKTLKGIDSAVLGQTYQAMGYVLYRQANYESALEAYQKAEQFTKDKQSRQVASISLNAGNVLSEIGDIRGSIDYYDKSLEISRLVGDQGTEVRSINNIGISYAQLGDLDSGIYYMKIGIELSKELNMKTAIANGYQALGSMNLERENIEEAKAYYELALAANLEAKNQFALSYNYQGLAAYYDRKGQRTGDRNDFLRSIDYAQKLIDVSTEIGAPERLMMGYEKMWDGLEMLGDYQSALSYHKKYSRLRDSVFNERKTRQLSEMKEKYDAEERDKEIQLQNEQIAKQAAVLTQESTIRNALIGGLLALVIIALLLYRNQRVKARKNQQIEALLKEIHHRVKNNLQVISSLLNMQSRGIEDEAMLETIKEGQGRVKAMSLIHQKLYQTESISEIDLQEYITELANQLKDLYVGEADRVATTISAENVKLDLDTAIPLGLILNELISNAYKYAFEGLESGSIDVTLERVSEDQLKLEVMDNGPGLPSGYQLDQAKSLGLKLVNILTKQLKGTLAYSTEGGSKFVINFKDLRLAG